MQTNNGPLAMDPSVTSTKDHNFKKLPLGGSSDQVTAIAPIYLSQLRA